MHIWSCCDKGDNRECVSSHPLCPVSGDGGDDGDSVAVTDGWYFLTGGIFS